MDDLIVDPLLTKTDYGVKDLLADQRESARLIFSSCRVKHAVGTEIRPAIADFARSAGAFEDQLRT